MKPKIARKPFWTRMCWGSGPAFEGKQVVVYRFATEAERDAFHLGVQEADGWLGWDADYGHGSNIPPIPSEWKDDEDDEE